MIPLNSLFHPFRTTAAHARRTGTGENPLSSRRRSRQGSIAPLMLGLMAVFTTVGISVVSLTQMQHKTSADDGKHMLAVSLAEAGIEHTIWRLQSTTAGYGPHWRNISDEQRQTVTDGSGNASGQYHMARMDLNTDGTIKGLLMEGWVPAVPPAGTTGSALASYVQAQIYAEVEPYEAAPFKYAAYGNSNVSIGGSDSYNSFLSPNGILGDNLGNAKGDTGTNNGTAGSNSVGSPFKGIGYYPPGGSSSVVSGSPSGGKMEDPRDNSALFYNVPVPPATAIPIDYIGGGKFKNLTTNQTIGAGMLTGGTYWVKGDVDAFELHVSVTPANPVILYLDGNLDVGGNSSINSLKTPPCLIIYGTENCSLVKMHGNGTIRAAIFAPKAEITLRGGGNDRWDIHGSFVGDRVVGKGSKTNFLYDEALSEIGGGIDRYRVTSWTVLR